MSERKEKPFYELEDFKKWIDTLNKAIKNESLHEVYRERAKYYKDEILKIIRKSLQPTENFIERLENFFQLIGDKP